MITLLERPGLAWRWLILLAAVGACAPSQTTARAAAPAGSAATAPAPSSSIATARPLLKVGTSGDYAPFSKFAEGEAPSGFDVELALALGRDLGFEVKWVKFRWPELSAQIRENAFDVAMSGVTWQPERAVFGYSTRSVARGGPCVVGDWDGRRLAVNHGGVLEAWARRTFPERELLVVDDNSSLPGLLAAGKVEAFVTDSLERRGFARPSDAVRCEAPLNQKIYWIAPGRAQDLGPTIDGWLRAHTSNIQEAQQRWFGEKQRLDATTNLVDLLARRFAFMPLVAALKNARGLPIEDLPREREVLDGVGHGAARLGLPQTPTVELFRVLIELSKAVERRQTQPTSLDLGAEIRPTLTALGDRILATLVEARAMLPAVTETDLEPLSPWLTAAERGQLLAALRAVAAPN